jgi:hypothetical protein
MITKEVRQATYFLEAIRIFLPTGLLRGALTRVPSVPK